MRPLETDSQWVGGTRFGDYRSPVILGEWSLVEGCHRLSGAWTTGGELVADSEVGDNGTGGRKDTVEAVEADKGRRQFLWSWSKLVHAV